MLKAILGLMAIFMATAADAAVQTRAALRQSPRAANAGVENLVRATTESAANITPVSVVNPNSGNVMTEETLEDGTTLYTDSATGEKFVMSEEGKLISYIDEDDRIVPQLGVSVKEARDACEAIETFGYNGEFNELTYECMVPIVGTNFGKVIKNSDGDAVAHYPFGSGVQCNAGIFENISVMRRTSQYVIPAMIVGGAGIGAGVGYLVKNKQSSATANVVTTNTSTAGQTTTASQTQASGAGTNSTQTTASANDSKEQIAKDLEILANNVFNGRVDLYCKYLPAKMIDAIEELLQTSGSEKLGSQTVNCLGEKEFLRPDKKMKNPALSLAAWVSRFDNDRRLLESQLAIEEFKTNTNCANAVKVKEFFDKNNGEINVEYVSLSAAKSRPANQKGCLNKNVAEEMIAITYKGKPYGSLQVPNDHVKTAVVNNLKTLSTGVGGTFNNDKFIDAIIKDASDARLSQLQTITNRIKNAKLGSKEKDDLEKKIAELTSQIENDKKKIKGTSIGSFIDKALGNQMVTGALIGAGAGAVGGLIYYFVEGSNTKCEVGDFKTMNLSETYRMPSFRDYLSGKR
ncbi:MAG: hypothetical protein LBB23_00345 [Rickettsiales bacterium]|jgi:uncharacterized protein YcfJ|nr:hypothetical protein [Rickettsiales bacterium]